MAGQERISANDFRKQIDSGKIKVGKKGKLTNKTSELVDKKVFAEAEIMFDKSKYIFIPGRVFSGKNSTQIRTKLSQTATKWKCYIKGKKDKVGRWQYVRPFVSKSENAHNYQSSTAYEYAKNRNKFREQLVGKTTPVHIEFIFVMPTLSDWDFNNMTQIVQDSMVDAQMIGDDNSFVMLPVPPDKPNPPFYIDKTGAGVYFRVKC